MFVYENDVTYVKTSRKLMSSMIYFIHPPEMTDCGFIVFELPLPESNTDCGQFAFFVTVSSFTPSRSSFVSSYESKISEKT
jgi:hypothetical protein